MQPEANPIPAWALQERELDRAWIRPNNSETNKADWP